MPPFSLSITIIPGIAILLNIFLYAILLRNTDQKKVLNRYVITTILLAFFLNVVWEILQIPLFEGGVYEWDHILFCIFASGADVIMVILIYFGFALIYKNALWIDNLNSKRIVLLILTGGAGAVLAEVWHLSIGTWSYASSMPLIPVVDVGLSPVLQFMTLPILIYSLSFNIQVKKRNRLSVTENDE